jgi:RNA polymerase sigma-70 factor (ECF subfamily)
MSEPGAGPFTSGGWADAASSLTLLLRAQQGDEGARDALYARYLPRLRRWAHGRLPGWARDHVDTEDLVQDTLLKSVKHLEDFSPDYERAFFAYVCESLRNRLRDALRHASRRPAADLLSESEPSSDPSPLELALGSQTLARYDAALQRLRPGERELIVARVELGLSYAEIAELLGKQSNDAARMAVSRALVRLAEEMHRARQG